VWRGVSEGLSGIVVRPLQGAAADGLGGFFAGLGRGAVGAVAAPVAGVFGAVSAVSESVEKNLKYWDRRPMGRRRDPRAPGAYHLLPSGSTAPLARGALPPLDTYTLLANLPCVAIAASSSSSSSSATTSTSSTPSRRPGPGSSHGVKLSSTHNSSQQSGLRSPRRPSIGKPTSATRAEMRTPPREMARAPSDNRAADEENAEKSVA